MWPIEEPKNNEGWHETLDESGVTAIRNRKTLDGDYSVEMGNLMRQSDLMEHDPRLRKKYLKSRNKDFKMWEPFYRQFAGTEYNQIWENFLQNYHADTLTNLVTPDNLIFRGMENIPEDFWDKHTDYYINNMPEYDSRAYKKQTEYVDLYPLTYDMSDNYDKLAKRVIKKNITKPAKFLSRLYHTPKALIGTWRANRYAKQQGAPKYMLKYDPVENVSFNSDSMLTSNYNHQTGKLNLGAWGSDIMDISISNVLAHEMAHTRKLYNTRDIERDADGNLINKRDDSKYYNNIYDYIDPRYKDLLAPTVDVDNNHDSELSEHYSDLLALRMGLRNAGINRGWRLYTNRDIEKFLNTYAGSQDRYLRYHTDLKKVRKALNRVWKEGGKLDQNSGNNKLGTYTPFILDNQILKFDDNMGLMSYNIPMISRAKNNLKEPVEENNFFTEQPILTNQPEQLTVVIPEETKEEVPDEKTYNGQHVFKHSKMNLGHMDAFLAEAAKYGIFFRVTSGVRRGAKTKQGKTSYHSLGHAIDITPIPGETYADLKYKIKNSPGLVKWMQDRGYGIFDETTPEVMARTGASGAHWHIGKDRVAIRGLQQIMES